MSAPHSPRTTSAAKAISPNTESFVSAPKVGSAFAESRDTAPKRGSDMVRQDRPKPQPRPSPGLAASTDAMAYNTRLKAEKDAADRRAAFFAKRKAQTHTRTKTRSRSS